MKNSSNFGMCFSREFKGSTPLSHIGKKEPVYVRLLTLCQDKGWNVFVLTRRTYRGNGVFDGVWKFDNGEFSRVEEKIKMDLVYDRTGGLYFPRENDNLKVVDSLDFKKLASSKWATYQEIGHYMPKTFWIGKFENVYSVLPKIKTDWIVVKPFNGMEGIGIYIGPKDKVRRVDSQKKYSRYIVQEFLNTSFGIPQVMKGRHDLRVVIVNGKIVWTHFRVPKKDTWLANVAAGGSIHEVEISKLPDSVVKIAGGISQKFMAKYDNPVYTLDFGFGKDGLPKIFEINDQMGFPTWEMKNRDNFLKALVSNFASKI